MWKELLHKIFLRSVVSAQFQKCMFPECRKKDRKRTEKGQGENVIYSGNA